MNLAYIFAFVLKDRVTMFFYEMLRNTTQMFHEIKIFKK